MLRSASAELDCNDDDCGLQSTVSASITGPGLFGVVVDGYGTTAGSYDVSITGL